MTISQAILAALAYHDIFHYPLTPSQTYSYLPVAADPSRFRRSLEQLITEDKIAMKSQLVCLKSRGAIVKSCLARKKASAKKLKKAGFYAKSLRFIPSIKLVGITGALAMENANTDDDIDLVIITAKGTLWTTRLFANLLLHPYRRKPHQPHTKNKACLNLFLDESSLKIGTRNLYIAHEIAQMRPIWQRQKTYQRFVNANSWIKKYLPNWQPYPADSFVTYQHDLSLLTSHYALVEIFFKKFQLWYMRPRMTTEKVGDKQLFFHPGNTHEWVLKEYQRKIRIL